LSRLDSLIRAKTGQAIAHPTQPAPIVDLTPVASKPVDRMGALIARGKTHLSVTHQLAESIRITSLPFEPEITKQEIEAMSLQYILGPAYASGWRLMPEQANGIKQFLNVNGLFAPIGVGKGKTLLTLVISQIAHSVMKKRKMLLVIPSHLTGQFHKTDLRFYRSKINISFNVIKLSGKSLAQRRRLAASDKPGLYVMPYSLFSEPDAVDLLESIAPEVVIADEVHCFARPSAARTRRFTQYMKNNTPIFAALSGTITKKTLKDYAHLAKFALGDMSFVPRDYMTLNAWSEVLGSSAESAFGELKHLDQVDMRMLNPLLSWAQHAKPDEEWQTDATYRILDYRKAFNIRQQSCRGVAASSSDDVGTSLSIRNTPAAETTTCDGWDKLTEYRAQMEDKWITPIGEEIEHAMLKYKWNYELSGGFYNDLSWPSVKTHAKRHRLSENEADKQLQYAKECHEIHKVFVSSMSKHIRAEKNNPFDTPMLVGRHLAEHRDMGTTLQLPDHIYEEWMDFKRKEKEGIEACGIARLPERDSTFIPVCDFKIRQAVKWAAARKKEGGIIWYSHIGMGKWMHSALCLAGVDSLLCASTPDGDKTIRSLGDPSMGGKGNKIVVASMHSHGTGKNLQAFYNQLFLQWPRSASQAEQVLGRIHRLGQQKDEVVADTNLTIDFDNELFAATLVDATYIHQTSGSAQKLIYARYHTMPRVYPALWLHDRGFQVQSLDRVFEKVLKERFN